MGWWVLPVVLVLLWTGACATAPQSSVPPAPPSLDAAPMPMPPVLAPRLSPMEEIRLRRVAAEAIGEAEGAWGRVQVERLGADGRETYALIESFLARAREAFRDRDFSRAVALAEKARILSDELSTRSP